MEPCIFKAPRRLATLHLPIWKDDAVGFRVFYVQH